MTAATRTLAHAAFGLLVFLATPGRAFAQAPATSPASPSAAAEKQGREHFVQGVALYREGNFGGARAEFQRAYDVAPSYRILFNLGESAFELEDYAAAIAAFSRYLTEGGAGVPPVRRAEVEKTLGQLEQRVGRLTITTSEPGVDIAVDGMRVGVTPLAAPVVVSVGRRTLTATMRGRIPISRTIDVAGGDHTNIALDVAAPEVAVVPAAVAPLPLPPVARPEPVVVVAPPAAPPPAHTSMAPFWVGVAGTGALAAGSVVFGVMTVAANSTLNSRLNTFPGSSSGIAGERSDVHTYALVADILGATAIAAAGVTVYLGVSHRSQATTSVGLGPGSARLRMVF
jgi:hypothetical protein